MTNNHLELLMPAGSMTKLKITLAYGADAVYLGPPLYSLRARENHFDKEELSNAFNYIRSQNKKGYMTLNIFARNRKLNPLTQDIKDYAKMKPNAFIISDPGLALIAKEQAPEIPIHLSVQANCTNWKSVQFWQKSLGVERIILSRELSINEIAEIKQRVPDIELEAFVHGSICIAYSGRCLLSSYMDKRDANQGVCDNSCREKYKIYEKEYFLQEFNSESDALYQVDEDEHGTYVLNAKDLCMLEHIDKLADAGVISFKVEGRTKSEFYAAMVARSYRHVIDDYVAKKPYNPYWYNELQKLSNRGYHTAFMLGDPKADGQNYNSSTVYNEKIKLLGILKNKDSRSLFEIKNKVVCGQTVDIVLPNGSVDTAKIVSIKNENSLSKNEVHSGAGLHDLEFDKNFYLPEHTMVLTHEDLAHESR